MTLQHVIDTIKREELEKMEKNVYSRICEAFLRCVDIRDFQACNFYLNNLHDRGKSRELIFIPIRRDLPELYESMLQDYIPFEIKDDDECVLTNHLKNAISSKAEGIIEYICITYPKVITPDMISYALTFGNISIVNRLRKVDPGFFPQMYVIFEKLVKQVIKRDRSKYLSNTITYLLDIGLRPDTYNSSFLPRLRTGLTINPTKTYYIENTPYSYVYRAINRIEVTHNESPIKLRCIFDMNNDNHAEEDATIEIGCYDGDTLITHQDIFNQFENEHLADIIENFVQIYYEVGGEYKDFPLYQLVIKTLTELPSLSNIAKNKITCNKINVRGLPLGLF